MIPDKTKFTDAEPGDGVSYCFVEECATPSAVVKPLQSEYPGSLLIYSPTRRDTSFPLSRKGSQNDFMCVIYNVMWIFAPC